MEAPMMTRLTGAILLSLILMIFGCDKAPKKTTTSTSTQVASPATQDTALIERYASLTTNFNEEIDKLNADLIILRDEVALISNDYTELKASPALNLTDQVTTLSADLTTLKEKVDSISVKVDSISKDINSISTKVDSMSNEYNKVAYRVTALEPSDVLLSTENEGYAVANTKFGPFIITKRGTSQYDDGFKIKLGIGNFTNATFKGARLNVTWGVLSGKDKKIKWINKQSKEFDITDELSSGAYTNVEIALTPASAEEIKTIQVGIELSQVYLKTK
jgi:archaellum component FlaC